MRDRRRRRRRRRQRLFKVSGSTVPRAVSAIFYLPRYKDIHPEVHVALYSS